MKHSIIAVSVALLSSASFAQSKFSAEVHVGSADQESVLAEDVASDPTSGSSTSIGLSGQYQFHQYFAAELGWFDYGDIDNRYIDEFGDTINETVASDSINAGIKAIWPLNDRFALNARLGLAFWNYEADATDSSIPGMTFQLDDSGNDFYYGIGLRYHLNEQFSIGADYTMVEMGTSISSVSGISIPESIDIDHEVKNLSLSLGYTF